METAIGLIYLLCNIVVVDPSGQHRSDIVQDHRMTVDLERGAVTYGPSWQIVRRTGNVISFAGTFSNDKSGTTSMSGSIDLESYNGSAIEAITQNGELTLLNEIISCRRTRDARMTK